MKKVLTVLLLSVATTFSAKAALFINNSSSCPVVLVFYAHDVNNPAACAYYSTRLEVPAGTAVAYNNVTNINSPGLGWYLPGTGSATLVTTGSDWDAVLIYSTDPAGPQTIVNPGTCATGVSYNASNAPCTFNARWMGFDGNTFISVTP